MIGSDYLRKQVLPLIYQKGLKIIYGSFFDDLMSAVSRSSVRIYKDCILIREIFCKAGLYRPDYMSNRISIVKAWDTDKNIGLANFFELLADFVS
jgi:hypothetical protein